jgi:SAM-dependent methyltransferase
MLHLAPEPFLQRRLSRLETLDYVSGDLESPWALVRLDVTHMPFEESSFDSVLCLHVLEHVADDRAAMREILRVLRPGASAIISCPVEGDATFEDESVVSARERRRIFGQDDHLRVYGRDLEQRLEGAGFVVEVVPFARELGDEACRRYGLDPSEDVYVCRKPAAERR